MVLYNLKRMPWSAETLKKIYYRSVQLCERLRGSCDRERQERPSNLSFESRRRFSEVGNRDRVDRVLQTNLLAPIDSPN